MICTSKMFRMRKCMPVIFIKQIHAFNGILQTSIRFIHHSFTSTEYQSGGSYDDQIVYIFMLSLTFMSSNFILIDNINFKT